MRLATHEHRARVERMKTLAFWLLLFSAWVGTVSAQVRVEVTMEQEQFLAGESIPVAVRITNRSGQALHLGEDLDWLRFTIETRDGQVVSQMDNVPVAGAFVLESSKVATKRVNLEPYFSFLGPERYKVIAILKVKAWDREISSPPSFFTINEGAKLWQQEFGLPSKTGDTNAPPEIRKYILQQANYLRGALRLYLRVTDAEGNKVFKVVPIGPLVSFSRPEPQIDPDSHLHLLYQNGPTSSSYLVFDTEGEVLLRQTYDIVGSRPRLRPDADGKITVYGGIRRESASDFPRPQPTDSEKSGGDTNQVVKPAPDGPAPAEEKK